MTNADVIWALPDLKDRIIFNEELMAQGWDLGTFYRNVTSVEHTAFNSWHNAHWPASSLAGVRGPHLLTLFKMKLIVWKEAGIWPQT